MPRSGIGGIRIELYPSCLVRARPSAMPTSSMAMPNSMQTPTHPTSGSTLEVETTLMADAPSMARYAQ